MYLTFYAFYYIHYYSSLQEFKFTSNMANRLADHLIETKSTVSFLNRKVDKVTSELHLLRMQMHAMHVQQMQASTAILMQTRPGLTVRLFV